MKHFLTASAILFLLLTITPALFAQATHQGHFRWRNDNGSETAATWRESQDTNDTQLGRTNIRLRIEMYSIDGATSGSASFYYSTDNVNFTEITQDSSVNAWALSKSTFFDNGDVTTEQLTASSTGGFGGGAMIQSTTSFTYAIPSGMSTEIEYCFKPTSHVQIGTYYFKIGGLNVYDRIPALNYTNIQTSVWEPGGIYGTHATLYGLGFPADSSAIFRFLWGRNSGVYTDSAASQWSYLNSWQELASSLSGLTPGTVYYYRVSGTTSSPSNYTVSGELSFMTPYATAGKALKLNSTEGTYVAINDANRWLGDIAAGGKYTIEAWIKPQSFSAFAGIVSKYNSPGSNGFTLRLGGTSPYTGINFDQMETATGVLTANTWYHIAAVNNNGTRTLYVNGIQVPLTGTPLTVQNNSDSVTIGVDYLPNPRKYDGIIDEVRIFASALDSTQIRKDMHRELDSDVSKAACSWQFDEGSGTTVQDNTGNLAGVLRNFSFNGTDGWVTSTAPFGFGTSVDSTISTSATTNLGTVSLIVLDLGNNLEELTGTGVLAPPDSLPADTGGFLSDRYWILATNQPSLAGGTYPTFTVPAQFTANGSANKHIFRLYQRAANADTAWSRVADSAMTVSDTSIAFSVVYKLGGFGQFMLGTSELTPLSPTPATPLGTAGEPRRTTFSWKSSANARSYHLQVASNNSLDNTGAFVAANVAFDTTTSDTSKKLFNSSRRRQVVLLARERRKYWRNKLIFNSSIVCDRDRH